ncbi:MAG: hypothetical protein WC026_01750, partial [Hyphomicrobium sp.]|uniref:hypothetical protein n=1 Tax=Hyphomicrobium sp. TaxID=82 RepID=UPI0035679F30
MRNTLSATRTAPLIAFKRNFGTTSAIDNIEVREHRISGGRSAVINLPLSTPERMCSRFPEQKCSTDASKKAPDIGGLLAYGALLLRG